MNYSRLKKLILDLFFPVSCLGCGRENIWLCRDCLAKIKRPTGEFKNFLKPNFLDRIIVLADYNDHLLSQALHCFKYKFVKDLGRDLAQLVDQEAVQGLKKFVLVPIPLHKKRLKFREFNQAEVVAQEISRNYNLELKTDILKREKYTPAQMSLKREARLENVKNVFNLRQKNLRGIKRVILVDDVLTTSATLNEAARVLKEAGVDQVIGLVLAHGS